MQWFWWSWSYFYSSRTGKQRWFPPSPFLWLWLVRSLSCWPSVSLWISSPCLALFLPQVWLLMMRSLWWKTRLPKKLKGWHRFRRLWPPWMNYSALWLRRRWWRWPFSFQCCFSQEPRERFTSSLLPPFCFRLGFQPSTHSPSRQCWRLYCFRRKPSSWANRNTRQQVFFLDLLMAFWAPEMGPDWCWFQWLLVP